MSKIDECLALYETLDYFVSYPRRPMGEDYWEARPDPDGKMRDPSREREQRKQDVAYLAHYLNAQKPARVLDIGCAFGELLELLDPKHEKFGLDLSRKALLIAREKVAADFRRATLSEAGFDAESFDFVVANHVIEHIPDPMPFLRDVRACLKPGGQFICGTPNFASAAARQFGDRFRLLDHPDHVSLFTDDSLLRFLRDNGFDVLRVDYPFFGTRFATSEAFEAMVAPEGRVSPPFWGSYVTAYARKKK